MTENDDEQLKQIEDRVRDLENRVAVQEHRVDRLVTGANRAAAALSDHEARLDSVEKSVRGRRNIERLEELER